MKRPLRVFTDILAVILFISPVALLGYNPDSDPIPYVTMLLVCGFGVLYFLEDINALVFPEE